MSDMTRTIEKILSQPIPDYSREEAREILIRSGIMDEDGNVRPAYRAIVVPKKDGQK